MNGDSAHMVSGLNGDPDSAQYAEQYTEYQADAGPWVLDHTVEGHPYWYNYDTGESSWYPPQEVRNPHSPDLLVNQDTDRLCFRRSLSQARFKMWPILDQGNRKTRSAMIQSYSEKVMLNRLLC